MNKRQKKKHFKNLKAYVAKMMLYTLSNDRRFVRKYSDNEIKNFYKQMFFKQQTS